MLRLGPVVVLLAWQLAAAGPAQAAAGELDPSFGTGGKVATDFPGSSAEVNALVLQADGTLVAAGQASSGSDYSTFDFALARYHPDGSLDPSFGSGGMVTTDFAGGTDLGRALVVQASGKLVVAGSATIGATTDFSAARTNDLDSVPGTRGG